jgi:hypothetical protein
MSTTTNFKRIALVAVAALGLGVLSSVPANAAVSGVTISVTNGATPLAGVSTTKVNSDTGTAPGASITVSALKTATTDSITVAFYTPYHGTPEQEKSFNKRYFSDNEKNLDAQLRSLSKSNLLNVEKLNYYKKNFVSMVRNEKK